MSEPEYIDRCLYGHTYVWRHYPATGLNEKVCPRCGTVAARWHTLTDRNGDTA